MGMASAFPFMLKLQRLIFIDEKQSKSGESKSPLIKQKDLGGPNTYQFQRI
jgi:hypothetical protein